MSGGAGGPCPPSCGLPPGYFDKEEGRALLDRIGRLDGERVLVAVAGAPGSGKSTLARALVSRLAGAVLVPMDGFHLDDGLLDARQARARKGAVDTFDAAGFVTLVSRLAVAGSEVVFPVFDRGREIAVAGAGCVAPADRIVVIEGNYLLLDRPPWTVPRYDLTVRLEVPEAELVRRLRERWSGVGKGEAQIAAHLCNDLDNARVVAAGSRPADLTLVFSGEAEAGAG